MHGRTSGVVMQIQALGARVASAAMNYALLVMFSRGALGDRTATELGVCLLQLPLLQQLVSFIAREGTTRAAARCVSSAAQNEQQQATSQRQERSAFNLSYLAFFACFCVSLLLFPMWLYLLPPGHGNSHSGGPDAGHAYSLAAAAFAAAGLVDAAAEVLSLRCLMLHSPGSRSLAEALSGAARSVLLAAALLLQQRARGAGVTLAGSVVMHPVVAFGGSHLCASLIFLQLLWLQCHRLLAFKTAAQRLSNAAEATAEANLVETPRLFVAWPAFLPLSKGLRSFTTPTRGSSETAGRGLPTSATPSASVGGAALTKEPASTALQWALGRYLSAEHLELLPTYLVLLAQKMLLQQGEQLLLLLLLDSEAAAEYAVTSGAASVLCRIIFSQVESAAFDGFCAMQKRPSAGFAATTTTDAAAGWAEFDTQMTTAVAWKQKCKSAWVETSAEQQLQLCGGVFNPEAIIPDQQLRFELHGSNSDTDGDVGRINCSKTAITGVLGSRFMAILQRLLGRRKIQADAVLSPSHPPALALLQLLLLLQGTVGLAAAAGGCLFAAPALRCFFGPSTVAPGSGFVQTLQVYCCYVCCLSIFGLLDAYASASCSSDSLRLLKRCYLAVTVVYLALLLPLSIRFSAAVGIPAGAGAAAAQVAAAVLRIGCCCFSISKDLGQASGFARKLKVHGYWTAPHQPVSQGSSDCSRRTRAKSNSVTTTCSILGKPPCKAVGVLQIGDATRHWNAEVLPVLWTILPPGARALVLRYSCCFVAAAAARSILRQASFDCGEGTAATTGYDLQQVMVGGRAVPLWVAEMSLAIIACAASVAAAGPLLMQQARDAYKSVAVATNPAPDSWQPA